MVALDRSDGKGGGFVESRDGTRLAYRSVGRGPDLVFVNGLSADDFYWRKVVSLLSSRARCTLWDLPGHGRSEPAVDPGGLSIEGCADDLGRVLDAVGAEEAVLLGFSLGCQIVLESWRLLPTERIRAMVLVLGPYGRPFDNVLHPKVGPLIGRSISMLGRRTAKLAVKGSALATKLPAMMTLNRALGVVGPKASAEEMRPYFDHLAVLDGPSWAGLANAAQRHSAGDLLADISVPVFIVAGGRDVFTPPAASRHMAATIPDSRLFFIDAAAHTGLVEYPTLIAEQIERFLSDKRIA